MKFRAKLHQYDNERLIAICDAELIGTSIHHNGVKLVIQERFYGELEYSVDEIMIELRSASSYNVMGKNICQLLIEKGMIHPDTVLWLGLEPNLVGHAIVVR